MKTIEWKEQNINFGLDYSTKTGKFHDYHFDIRYDYDGNPKIRPTDCNLVLDISKKGHNLETKFSKNISVLVLESYNFMREEQRILVSADFE